MGFEHQRHKPPQEITSSMKLLLALPQLQSNVNLARIVRAAGCCGLRRIIVEGKQKIDAKIARDSIEQISIQRHRSLLPQLSKLQFEGYQLIGLEQTTNSENIHSFRFPRRSVLVIGHERHGIGDEMLRLLDGVVEIPVFGRPFSYNVATATAMVLYEFCRQRSSDGRSA